MRSLVLVDILKEFLETQNKLDLVEAKLILECRECKDNMKIVRFILEFKNGIKLFIRDLEAFYEINIELPNGNRYIRISLENTKDGLYKEILDMFDKIEKKDLIKKDK